MPNSLLFGLVVGGLVGAVLGTTMGYRWGLAATRWRDWRKAKKGIPLMRAAAFGLVRLAMNPTGLMALVVIGFSCWVYVQARIN